MKTSKYIKGRNKNLKPQLTNTTLRIKCPNVKFKKIRRVRVNGRTNTANNSNTNNTGIIYKGIPEGR